MCDDEQSLTSSELRNKLYNLFKKRGLHDSLKKILKGSQAFRHHCRSSVPIVISSNSADSAVLAQLRNQLIVDLRRDSLPQTSDESDSLSMLLSNSLIIHHLRNCGYEYTLSIFYPECGLSKEKVFSIKDILQCLKISQQLSVYKNLVSDIQNGQKGLLVNLLSEFMDHRQVHDADTQTSNTPDYRESIVKKMQLIDEEYDMLRQKGNQCVSVEAKLRQYRKEMEEQAHKQLKLKIQHFQDVEIAQVRMEEKEKCRQELEEIRHQLERTYKIKLEALKSREKNAIERLQKQQEMEEKEMYVQRQALLKEMESIRNREAELIVQIEAFEKLCKMREEKMSNAKGLLRKRELDVRRMEEMYELRLHSEVKRQQMELEKDYDKRTETLKQNEIRNKEEMDRIQRESTLLQIKKEEHKGVGNELIRAQEELSAARANMAMLMQNNVLLEEKLASTGDHETMCKERMELQAEIGLLKKQLEESEKEKQMLRQELNKPSQEVLTLQADLKRTEMAWQLDKKDFLNQKQLFHSQLSQEVDRCAQLKVHLQECEERTKWMTTHTEEIKCQLQHIQQALENEVLHDPKLAVGDHFVFDNMVISEGYNTEPCFWGTSTRGQQCSLNIATEMVSEALTRIQKLEEEAETLEEIYRSYRQKADMSRILFKGKSLLPCALSAFGWMSNRARFAHGEPALPSIYTETEQNQAPTSHVTPPTLEPPSFRRLSSTPVSAPNTRPSVTTNHDSHKEVSPIPILNSEENLTLQRSPQLKNTVHHDCRFPELQTVSSSSQESSPQHEKISIQDLTSPLTYFHGIVQQQHEQQQEEAPRHDQEDCTGDSAGEHMEEDEHERKLGEEMRWREGEEAQEKPSREQQMLQQAMQEAEFEAASENMDEKMDIKTKEEKKIEEKSNGEREEPQVDPLHKYMLVVMKERQYKEQNSMKDSSEIQSPKPIVLSDHGDDSIPTVSHEADNEYW